MTQNTQATYPAALLFGLAGEQTMIHTPVGWVNASIVSFPVDHSSEDGMEVLISREDEQRIHRFYEGLNTPDATIRPITTGDTSTTSLAQIKQVLEAEIARKRTSEHQQAMSILQTGREIGPEQRDFLINFIRKYSPS